MEMYIEEGAAFGFALMLLAASLIAVMVIEPERLWTSVATSPPVLVGQGVVKMSFSTPSPSSSSPLPSPSPSMSEPSPSLSSPTPTPTLTPSLIERPILITIKVIIVLASLAAIVSAIGAMCDWGVSGW
ncbi:hypothetical protein EON63_13630 [archaeon]|nr:MAG: hypothetical protein EON63_13630 [archaeon]